MPELLLKKPRFTYSACRPFVKHRGRTQKFKETGNLNYFYKNELNKPCSAHDAWHTISRHLAKSIVLDKILKHRAYEIALNPTYDGYKRGVAITLFKFFDTRIESRTRAKEVLSWELHKPVVKKCKRRKIITKFKDKN